MLYDFTISDSDAHRTIYNVWQMEKRGGGTSAVALLYTVTHFHEKGLDQYPQDLHIFDMRGESLYAPATRLAPIKVSLRGYYDWFAGEERKGLADFVYIRNWIRRRHDLFRGVPREIVEYIRGE